MSVSDPPGGTARLDLASPSALVEITVVGSDFRPVASGLGQLTAEVPAGLYQVVLRAGPTIERRLISVSPGTTHADHGLSVSFPSAAPVGGSSTSHEYHMELATEASSRAETTSTGTWLVMLVRDPRGLDGPPLGDAFLDRLELLDAGGMPVAGFQGGWTVRAEQGAAAWSGALPPGAHFLRIHEGDTGPIDASLWMQTGWQCVVFLTRDASGEGLSLASVHMVDIYLPWSPIEDGVANATELVTWALRERRAAVPRAELNRLLGSKFRDPMLGIIGAHALLLDRDADLGAIDTVLGNLDMLIPGHPDLTALHWMAEDLRARQTRRPMRMPADASGVQWPPMLRASYTAMIAMDAAEPGAITDGSIAEHIGATLVDRGIWTTWRPVPATPSPGLGAGPEPSPVRPEAEAGGEAGGPVVLPTVGSAGVGAGVATLDFRRFDDPATARVGRYLATVAELEGAEAADQRLAEMTTAEVCLATQLPTATVERSLRRLAYLAPAAGQTHSDEHGSDRGGDTDGPSGGGSGAGGGGGGGSLPFALLGAVVLMLALGGAAAVAVLGDGDPTPTPSVVPTPQPTGTVAATASPTPTPTPTPTPGIGIPVIEPREVLFEPTRIGFTLEKSVGVTNGGDGPLSLANPTIAGPARTEFTVSSDCAEEPLEPDDQCEIRVTFGPRDIELRDATLVVASRTADPIEVSLRGIGQPEGVLEITPAIIDYGQAGQPDGFTVRASGPVVITAVTLDEPPPADFSIDPSGCIGTLDEGESCFVRAEFSSGSCSASTGDVVFTTFWNQEYRASMTANIVC